jgi:hypothetical protein
MNVNVVGTRFDGAHLEGADLKGAMGFGAKNLGLYYDRYTLWPKADKPTTLGTFVAKSQHKMTSPCSP